MVTGSRSCSHVFAPYLYSAQSSHKQHSNMLLGTLNPQSETHDTQNTNATPTSEPVPPPPAVDDSRQPRLERKPKPKGRKSGRRNPEFSRICVCLESRGPVEKRSVGTPAVGPCAGSLEMQHGVLDWVSRHLHKEFRLPKVLLRSPTRPTHRASMHGISFIGAFL